MPERIPVIMDGDPGHDDAIAWMLAGSSDKLDIRAVTSVCGNQTIDKTTYNALRICTLLGLKCPVGKGRPTPMVAPPMVAANIHGESGLDGPKLPEPAMDVDSLGAVELMAKTIRESDEKVQIVATGPQTNVATLLVSYPELKEKIRGISLMGGGVESGNWTPAAEFNILVDPEAADIVFKSGLPIYMAGLDVTEKALIFPEDFERIRSIGNEVSRVVAEWLEFFYIFHKSIGYAGAPVHDPVAIVALIAPEILEIMDMHIDIETRGQYCRGMTVGNVKSYHNSNPNAKVILGIDRDKYADLLYEACKYYGG